MDEPVHMAMQPHSAHWGAFSARSVDGKLVVAPHPADPDPNRLIENFISALGHKARVSKPMVRRGWLRNGPGPDDRRGLDDFLSVSWADALDLVAGELRRVVDADGPAAIFGGSYGWSSAGRFHHAQSQVHRFLNTAVGGYVRSIGNYSAGASTVILPHILGELDDVALRNVTWAQIVEHTDVVLAFGGMALKNSRVGGGGISQHTERGFMTAARERGCRFVTLSPLRSDLPPECDPEWWAVTPGTDAALMLGMLHRIVSSSRHDRQFLSRYCEGWAEFEGYLFGKSDQIAKTPAWAAEICGLSEHAIVSLADALPGKRVLVVVSHSLQRSEHGEQPVWMGAVLAAALGQIGLPGGGLGYALGALAHYGKRCNAVPIGTLSQGTNSVDNFIPVARISDMLLHPGTPFEYNGKSYTYPKVRLAYWAGGNPFHHHQDLNRLRTAFARLDSFVVHEIAWTATARHADIVLPCTMTLEREDIGASRMDPLMVAMHRIAPPHASSRDDFEIFSDLAERLGKRDQFTGGRTSREWLVHLYERTRSALDQMGLKPPDFDTFWRQGELTLPQQDDDGGILRAFRQDPTRFPLPTESGRIQITSAIVSSFGYADCPGHAMWLPPVDGPSPQHPLILVANQPATRLHSQLDFGDYSSSKKHRGREICTMHPVDAAARGIAEGDAVRLYNDRGACLAAATLGSGIKQGVVQLPTGSWFDPATDEDGKPLCLNGNPNALTRDVGTSSLAQGSTGQLTAVQVELFKGPLPTVRAYDPPTG